MYHEFATDPKVQMLSECDQRRFVMLLCFRCCNGDVTLHDDAVAFQLRISIDEWKATKVRFVERGLIGEDNQPTAWEKRQFASDRSNERVLRHRAKKAAVAVTECNVTVTPPEEEADTETEKKDTPLPPRGPTPLDALRAFEAYNATALRSGLPQAAKLTPDRQRKIIARLKDYGLDGWMIALGNIEKSSFLTGGTDAGFRADLDFMVQAKSFGKLHDGGYGNGRHTIAKRSSDQIPIWKIPSRPREKTEDEMIAEMQAKGLI